MSDKQSRILNAMHETARRLYKVGVMNEITMREFDALCLPDIPEYSAKQIKKIRLHNKASQAVFAAYLNISLSTVQKWEQGQKKPGSIAFKLLDLVQKRGLQILET
jgi:putative transcriptional regulator